jgi:hypothetical protein
MIADKMKIAASRMVLDHLYAEDLAEVAGAALENGYDSPSLRMLARLTRAEADQARAMFERALRELAILIPNRRDAVMRLARETAEGILSGTTDAYEGAKQIWVLTLRAPEVELPELDSFVYAASEWEDRPEDGQDFREGVLAAARELLST